MNQQYAYEAGFHVLSDVTADFLKLLDNNNVVSQNTFGFLEDNMLVNTGSKEEHLKQVKRQRQLAYHTFEMSSRQTSTQMTWTKFLPNRNFAA